ncbi:unnamed protein product [Mytilus coruscus]|uniref:DZIP3-like HEPN domain-containing protein n=1 Tax=Mytilus coruscus TaxID=42192 RepID=A0A6J8C1P2_MYTCO|nr:unnamed protein product [Mytilus coruscus]
MSAPSCGFDQLPAAMETTPAADLARIKHYRNNLAHLDNGKIDIAFFNTAWNDLTGAIGRLGGLQMRQECDHMKTKPLDQNNEEIILDIKHSRKEVQVLKDSLESLKLSHTEMIKSHESLQENHAVVTKEIEEIKIYQMDTVPWNIRGKLFKGTWVTSTPSTLTF